MNPTHRTRPLSVTLAALAAATLALPACADAAAGPHHPSAHVMAKQAQNGVSFADLQDIARAKGHLFPKTAPRAQTGLSFADLQDIANAKRGLFQALAQRRARR